MVDSDLFTGSDVTDQSRYQKQMLFAGVGKTGQALLAQKRVLLTGCGALGCVLADAMARAGVGHLRIVDRDFVELSNLQRQILFTEQDVKDHLPKAVCAQRRLRQVNSQIEIDAIVADVDYTNVREFADGCDLILDGTDNFEIRYLLNDVALELGIPWIFTGCTGSNGQMMPILPGDSACLRCLMPSPPPPGSTETCDTAGVLGPAINVIASLQASVAIKILTEQTEYIESCLTVVDVWENSHRKMDVSKLRETSNCPACLNGERLWLKGTQSSGSSIMCGRNAVQVTPAEKTSLSLEELAVRLELAGTVTSNPFLVRVAVKDSDLQLTVFPDGRAIIKGTEDPAVARSVYSRYIGS